MSIPLRFEPVIELLHARLQASPHPWAITGSLGMALQGMALDVHDIDLQTTGPGALDLQARLAEYVVTPVYTKVSETMRSEFGVLAVSGVQVEIMGDLVHRLPAGGWDAPPALPAITRRVEYRGMLLPVLDLEHEYAAYLRMGRAAKAEQIKRWLEASRPSRSGN